MDKEIIRAIEDNQPVYAAPVYVDELGYLHCSNAKLFTSFSSAERYTFYQLDLGMLDDAIDYIIQVHTLY